MLTIIIVCTLALALFAGLTLLRIFHFNKSANADMIVQAYAAFSYAGKPRETNNKRSSTDQTEHSPSTTHFHRV